MANITGTAGNDFVHRADDGLTPPFGYTDFATATDVADVITTGFGNDIIRSYAGNDSINSGEDDDQVDAGIGNDTVNAGTGNDIVIGGQGTDTLIGGVGTDIFRFQAGSDISGLAENINGGTDEDTLDFQTFNAFGSINISLATISNIENLLLASNTTFTLTASQLGGFNSISGTFGVERLVLSAAGTADLTGASISLIDAIDGSGGDDTVTLTGVVQGQTVNGLGGNDTLNGGSGDDALNGGIGNDTLNGSFGNDTLTGDIGTDTLTGSDGNDILIGGVARDVTSGGVGNDIVRFNLVSDVSGLTESIDGGIDYDRIDFQFFNASGAVDLSQATITGVEQLDLSNNDVLLTGAQLGAFERITGGFGYDRLTLSAPGTADLTGATLSLIDEIRGSAGNDIITLTGASGAVTVNGDAGGDVIRGTNGSDALNGQLGNDTLFGNDGDDVIQGGQNIDRMYGGVGYDTFQIDQVSDISGLAEIIDGGSDIDKLDFQTLSAPGAVDLTKVVFTSVEQLLLSNNDATLTAAQLSAFDGIFGGFGVDRLILSAPGTVDLTGATLSLIDEIRGTSGNDIVILTGVTDAQRVNGLGGTDTITGGEGNDLLNGGAGNDTIQGGGGADTITGELGTDTMTGGAGADVFDFNDATDTTATAARDVITDFVHGQDVINLTDVDADSTVAGNQGFTFIGAVAFSGTAGELRYTAANGLVQGDIDGNGIADFQIQLSNLPATITGIDFLL